jgi:hypothetical protein
MEYWCEECGGHVRCTLIAGWWVCLPWKHKVKEF